jgi:GTPase Era involved in 16S rRNA processing
MLIIVDTPGRSTRHDSTQISSTDHRCSPNNNDGVFIVFFTEAARRNQRGEQHMMKQLCTLSCPQYCSCHAEPFTKPEPAASLLLFAGFPVLL